jgi:Transposase zinc-binding domain/Putative transposase
MDRPRLEVADVFRCYGTDYRLRHGASMSMAQRRVMTAIEVCRTAVLGGHLEQCDHCGHQRNAYNSCSDRHCPKCQPFARAQWLEDRQSELLDTQYFHMVFTVPEQIATIAYQNKRELYRHDAQQKTMTLQAEEFIRRFLLHVLPEGFQRIRYYGFLANRYREEKLARCRDLLGMPSSEPAASEADKDYSERYEELTGSSLWECPVCHQGRMLVIEIFPRSPNRHVTPIKDTS